MPLLSAIITAFNRRNVILDAIRSVQVQTINDMEIIVVDDASTDGTGDAVLRITDDRIRLIKNTSNLGIGGAKNVGLREARGQYVAFLDSDDTWHPDKSEVQIAHLENLSNVPLSFCAFYVTRVGNPKKLLRVPKRIGTWFDSILLGETTSLGSTLLARRDLFDQVGLFSEEIRRLQDREWLIRYFDHYDDFLVVKRPLCTVNNSEFPAPELVADSIEQLFKCCEERVTAHGKTALSKFRAALEFEMAVARLRAGAGYSAAPHLLRALTSYPPFVLSMARRGTRKLIQGDFS